MAKKKEFVISVVVEAYDRYENQAGRLVVHRGKDEVEVLTKIINKHGYGLDEDGDYDKSKPPTAKQIWKKIKEQNGDGCDLISAYFIGEPIAYKGPGK